MGAEREDRDVGPTPIPNPQNNCTPLQYLKSRLNDPRVNILGVSFPDFKAPNFRVRKENDKTSFETCGMSWSVMRQISSTIKPRMTVHCLTQDIPAPAEESKPESSPPATTAMTLEEEVRNFIAAETGKDRLRRAWNTKKYTDEDSPKDLEDAVHVGFNCSLVGFIYGLIKYGKEESDAYLVRSRTRLFGSRSLANKRLANTVIGYGMRKGLKLGVFSFVGSFSITLPDFMEGHQILEAGGPLGRQLIKLVSTHVRALYKVISIYHNTSAPWTVALSTGTVLSVWKSSLGIKGAVGGFIIGNVFGLVFGIPFWLLLKAGGIDQEQENYRRVEAIIKMKRFYRGVQPAVSDIDDEDEKVD